jgi:DNA-binding XRE family transcriptional regulator
MRHGRREHILGIGPGTASAASSRPKGGGVMKGITLDHKAIGHRLAQLRWRLQIDEHEAARRAGVTVRSWLKWERGAPFNTYSMLKICCAFDCSSNWLCCGDGRVLCQWPDQLRVRLGLQR